MCAPMKKRSCAFLLALCLLLTACGCDSGAGAEPTPSPVESATPETEPTPEPTPELSQREQDWREDFAYLKETLVEVHPDPFWCCSEEDFDWKIEHLASRVSGLTDNEIFFELMQILAGLRDNHLGFDYPALLPFEVIPIEVRYFDGHLYMCGYYPGYDQLAPYLLQEIVAVNGIDITYIFQKLSTLSDLNDWSGRERFPSFLIMPAFLDMAGCGYRDGYTFQFLNENREVVSVEMPVLSEDEYKTAQARNIGRLVRPENWDSLPYLKKERRAEYIAGENGSCVYMSVGEELQDRGYLYSKLMREAEEIARSHEDCSKLVIDLRPCPGGDWTGIEQAQEKIPELLEPGIEQVYVLTNGYTASASMTALALFRDELGAVIVGEPTGQFSSLFAFGTWPSKYTLPNSQITINIADMQYTGPEIREVQYDENGKLYEWENTILPDVYVPQDIEDIRRERQWRIFRVRV